MRASHRIRLTLATSGAVAVVLAILFVGIWSFLRTSEFQGAQSYLTSGLAAATEDLKSGPSVDLQEWASTHPRASLEVYEGGRLIERAGRPMADDGVVVSRQTSVGDKAVVAKLDWVEWTQSLRKLSLALWTLFPALVGMVALVTWLSAKATFVPLQEMTNQASAIGGSDLSARIDVEDAAEFGMFAHQLNGLLGRIEQAVKTQEQFAADAAHELRTPLTVMQGKLETALLSKRTPTEYAETLRAVLGEVGRLSRLTEALLQTAKPDEAAPPPLELEPIVSDVASRWLDRFVSKGLDLHVATSAAEAPIKREEIECVLDNLLENAFRYSPPGTGCSVELDTNDQRVELSVEDSGSGLAGAAGEKAFERFWREDEARSRQSGGFGLGLAICKKLVEARGGKIFVDDSYRKGTRIVVSFKASSRA